MTYGVSNIAPSLGAGASKDMIDLRSDTMTRPTPSMMQALAELTRDDMGDDVYGEDPTINELQRVVCELTGKEAALFVPSGTMGNLASVLSHCGRGQELLLGDESHIFHYEAGGVSALGGVSMYPLPTLDNGEIPLEAMEEAHSNRPDDQHAAPIGCIALENTHNRKGGRVLSLEYMRSVRDWAVERGYPVHLDGARAFNAAAALGVPIKDVMDLVTSATFCLSKGLGAPVGSVIVGPAAFVKRAHRLRKMLGGGLRQGGVLAAMGLVALREVPPLLAKDHSNAKAFAKAIANIDGVVVDMYAVDSNIVILRLTAMAPPRAEVVKRLQDNGVLVCAFKDGIRAVWHLDVNSEQVPLAAEALRKAVSN